MTSRKFAEMGEKSVSRQFGTSGKFAEKFVAVGRARRKVRQKGIWDFGEVRRAG